MAPAQETKASVRGGQQIAPLNHAHIKVVENEKRCHQPDAQREEQAKEDSQPALAGLGCQTPQQKIGGQHTNANGDAGGHDDQRADHGERAPSQPK